MIPKSRHWPRVDVPQVYQPSWWCFGHVGFLRCLVMRRSVLRKFEILICSKSCCRSMSSALGDFGGWTQVELMPSLQSRRCSCGGMKGSEGDWYTFDIFWLDSCDLHVQSSYLSFVRFNVICGNRCFFMFLLLSWPLTSPNTLHLGPLFENLLQVCYKSAQVETSWKEDFATRLQNGGCELQLC